MIEIIEPGHNNGINMKYYNTCPYCQCKYSYDSRDMCSNLITNGAYAMCPCCGKTNMVYGVVRQPLNQLTITKVVDDTKLE